MLNEKKFKEGMFLLCETFQREASEILLKGYWLILKALSDVEFEKAVVMVLSTRTFGKLPLPAEILEAAQGNIEDKANIALTRFEDAMQRIGHCKSVVFDDSVIHMVVQALGDWQQLCLMPIDEWKWARKEFISLYKTFSTNPRQEYPEKLLGFHDHNNMINGHIQHIQEPVLIGDKHRAMAVLTHMTTEEKPLLEAIGGIK